MPEGFEVHAWVTRLDAEIGEFEIVFAEEVEVREEEVVVKGEEEEGGRGWGRIFNACNANWTKHSAGVGKAENEPETW